MWARGRKLRVRGMCRHAVRLICAGWLPLYRMTVVRRERAACLGSSVTTSLLKAPAVQQLMATHS